MRDLGVVYFMFQFRMRCLLEEMSHILFIRKSSVHAFAYVSRYPYVYVLAGRGRTFPGNGQGCCTFLKKEIKYEYYLVQIVWCKRNISPRGSLSSISPLMKNIEYRYACA